MNQELYDLGKFVLEEKEKEGFILEGVNRDTFILFLGYYIDNLKRQYCNFNKIHHGISRGE